MKLIDVEMYYKKVYDKIKDCQRCPLGFRSTRKVAGSGIASKIWLIGEAPGAQEEKQGLPFVGRAGMTLNAMLKEAGLSRDMFFITNITKCRPVKNRTPTEFEVYECIHASVIKEMAVLRPEVIITMGNTATQGFMRFVTNYDKPVPSITTARTIMYVNKPERIRHVSEVKIVLPVFHPSYCLRNRMAYVTSVDDFKKIKSYLDTGDITQLMRKGRWLYD